jgi:predicted metalloenzyme YecM
MSLSLFSSVEIEIFIDDDQNLDYTKKRLPNEGWNHISIILQNNNVVYLLNGEVFKRVDDFSPRELVVKHRSPIFFKIHNCKYFNMSRVF